MLYLHTPYCHRKCTYCAFYSTVTQADKQGYVDALCRELELRQAEMPGPLRTIYFGGGTPSILTIAQLQQIATTINQCYDTHALEEVTLEANPEDLTPQYLSQLRTLGLFNRISIGVQSFSDTDLHLLNRRHNAQQSIAAVRNASAAGFDNISIDLIYGLPNQDIDSWQRNLSHLNDLPISHLSAYALTIEDGTMLYRQIEQGRLRPADETTVIKQYQALLKHMGKMGLEQYEISNFARHGRRSRHNSRYWDRTPYLGIGAAAHSFDGQHRRWNISDAQQYIALVQSGGVFYEQETLSQADAYNEYVMTALRTLCGIEKAQIQPPFVDQLRRKADKYIQAGLLTETATHYRPTPEGLLHADGIASELFVDLPSK